MSDHKHSEREHFFGAAKVITVITMISRVLGLVRDMLMVPLGDRVLADRFWTAFAVPNLFRRLFGEGALSAAFVPVFTEVSEAEGWDRARVVLANVAGLLAVVLAGLLVLGELGIWAAWSIWGGDEPRQMLLLLSAIMLPYMVTVCLLALGSAALNCKGHFAYPAFAPILLNVVLISAAVIAPRLAADDSGQFTVLAVSLIIAGVIQLLGVIWMLRRIGLGVVPKLRPILPEIKRIAVLMAPMVVPLSVLQLSVLADKVLALMFTGPDLPLSEGVVGCLYASSRVYQLPMGVLAIPLATAIFPLFSRYAVRGDIGALRETTNCALRLGAFLAIPAAVALILLAEITIEVLFERRKFSPADTARTALMLRMYCLGMWAYFWNHVLLRAFFAQKDTRTPLILSLVLAGFSLPLVVIGFYTPLKAASVGAATALAQTINALWLISVLRSRWGRLGLRSILVSLLRTGIATVVMAGAVGLALLHMETFTDLLGNKPGKIAVLAAAIVAGGGAYLLAARLLRCPELGELFGSLRKRREGSDNAN